MRIAFRVVDTQANLFEDCRNTASRLGSICRRRDGIERFGNQSFHSPTWIETAVRVLEHRLNAPTGTFGREFHLSPLWAIEAQNHPEQAGLSGPRFTDQAHCL